MRVIYVYEDSEDIFGVPLSKKLVAVITTYTGQVALVRSRTGGVVDVYTVDKSQGQERDVIILSMVRSNAKGHLGFITDRRRINVALTRAKDGCYWKTSDPGTHICFGPDHNKSS